MNISVLQLQILNLGNNEFEELPEVLEYLTMLEKLHLFNNNLKNLTPKVLSKYKAVFILKKSMFYSDKLIPGYDFTNKSR